MANLGDRLHVISGSPTTVTEFVSAGSMYFLAAPEIASLMIKLSLPCNSCAVLLGQDLYIWKLECFHGFIDGSDLKPEPPG